MFTRKPIAALTALVTSAALMACGATSPEDANDGMEPAEQSGYDMDLLEQYRSAIPSDEQVKAPSPAPEGGASALTLMGNAQLAGLAASSALSINIPAVLVVTVLRAITKLPPTFYDSEKKEFVWGPWDNEDGYGKTLVYIRENPEGDDFKYGYALVRLDGNDIATAAPVIWGGATPGATKDRGVGVTLWDFVANEQFEQEYDPAYDASAPRDKGRFAMVFGAGDDEKGEFAFNVAVFRDFVSKDEPENEPANLDYFYGHFEGDDGNVMDFVDWSLDANLCETDAATCFEEPAEGEIENLGLRAAFFNHGVGRAEAKLSGGDLGTDVNVVECWDEDIDRVAISLSDDSGVLINEGECTGAFASDLATLGVPSLADLDADMLAKMDCVATNGFAACEDAK